MSLKDLGRGGDWGLRYIKQLLWFASLLLGENNLLPETTKEIGILGHCIGADWEKRQGSKSITLILMFEPQQANYYQVIE